MNIFLFPPPGFGSHLKVSKQKEFMLFFLKDLLVSFIVQFIALAFYFILFYFIYLQQYFFPTKIVALCFTQIPSVMVDLGCQLDNTCRKGTSDGELPPSAWPGGLCVDHRLD